MSRNPLQRLADFGQSVWLDYIERGFVQQGELARLIEEAGLGGLTSNPAIFRKAIAENPAYIEAIEARARDGLAAHEIQELLVIEDIRAAAAVLAEVYRRSEGGEGYVSLEVSPHLARDAEGTYWEAKRLWALVARENLMIKVPGTRAGLEAVRRLIADGINVNITLLFSVERYAAVADAYLRGLEERAAQGEPLEHIASVASFFLSRIDTLVDGKLDALGDPSLADLRGTCAVACARTAYRQYQSIISGPRWGALAARGARPQRLLWASTGTKDPAYSDVKYVDALVGPQTITTVPPETLVAYRDHGDPALQLPEPAHGEALSMTAIIRRLGAVGIEWAALGPELEEQGIAKFIEPYDAMLAALEERVAAVHR